MQESKYQVANWKKWKATRNLLASTKNELMNDVKAISYTNELPGGSHKSVAEKYNKLIDDLKIYDEYIRAYDVLIFRLENAITNLLNEEQRKILLIYANHPAKGDYRKREDEALLIGLSRSNYYSKLSDIFNILDDALVIDTKNNKKIKDMFGLIED